MRGQRLQKQQKRPAKSPELTSISAIDHLLTNRPDRIRQLLLPPHSANKRVQRLEELAREAGVAVHPFASKREEYVKARLAPFHYSSLEEILEKPAPEHPPQVLLALDHIQDPQNFGALVRSAEGLGVSGVLLPKDRSVSVTPAVYQASVGAVGTLPISQVGNLSETLRRLKEDGYWLVGTTLGEGATPPWEVPDFEKIVLIMGAEGEGLSAGIEKMCDWKTHIPQQGAVQSFNVSAAGAMFLYELLSRRTRSAR